MSSTSENDFLRDLSTLLIEQAAEAKAQYAEKKKEGDPADWEKGQLFGLFRALSLIEQQAEAFQFTKEEVGLAGFSADSLLNE